MTEFCSGQSAVMAHQALKSSLDRMDKAKQCSVLWFEEINKRQLYRELGYGSINQYAEQELGFSATRTGDYLQLCRSFKKLPQVKEKIESGELGYTAARVLARVANEENEKGWLDYALNNSRRELEKEVKRATQEAGDQAAGYAPLLPLQPKRRPAAVVPVRVDLEMTPTQFARYEKLWEQIRKQRSAPADKVEALLLFMEEYAVSESGEESSPRGDVQPLNRPPAQIHIHHCPECEKAVVPTGKGELALSRVELERAQCDCQSSRPNKRNTTSIPPSVRRLVLARARHQCQRTGCNHHRFLEIHHVIPRSMGGANDPSNCVCLCSACHGLVHRQKVGMAEFVMKEPAARYHWKLGSYTSQKLEATSQPRNP